MPSDIQAIAGDPAVSAAPPRATVAADHGWRFHDVLSALNPLQYLPVVGTIYRAVTGDVIPEGLRRFGSMVVSGLAGGPIGLLVNIASTVAEKATGIDPDKIIIDRFNPAAPTGAPTQVAATAPAAAPTRTAPPLTTPTPTPLSPEQLAAYGVTMNTAGNLTLGAIQGADVLNAIQLANLTKTAAAAYAANQSGFATGPA